MKQIRIWITQTKTHGTEEASKQAPQRSAKDKAERAKDKQKTDWTWLVLGFMLGLGLGLEWGLEWWLAEGFMLGLGLGLGFGENLATQQTLDLFVESAQNFRFETAVAWHFLTRSNDKNQNRTNKNQDKKIHPPAHTHKPAHKWGQ
jgi:hypothetical protein